MNVKTDENKRKMYHYYDIRSIQSRRASIRRSLNVRDATATNRHKQKLFKPRPRTNIRKNAFSHRVVSDWNSLPANVVEAPTLNSFKSRLNKHWVGPSKFEAQCYN